MLINRRCAPMGYNARTLSSAKGDKPEATADTAASDPASARTLDSDPAAVATGETAQAAQPTPPGVRGDAELQEGLTVGEYKVTGKIGAGGMGTVYAGV